MADPIQMIKDRITQLRQDHENSEGEIASLQQEKDAIQQVLPKVIHELMTKRNRIESMHHEVKIYDKAICEVESNYGHVIFSPAFYAQKRQNAL